MAGILDLLGMGGGAGGGPRPLTPAAVAGGAGAASGGGMEAYLEALNNPMIAGALGLGGGLLASGQQGGTFGQGLRSGLGAGLGGFIGAGQLNRKRKADEKRDREMEELLEKLKRAASRHTTVPAMAARGGSMTVGGARGGGALPYASGLPPGPGRLAGYGGLI